MPRLILSARRSAISMLYTGYSVAAIQQRLKEEDVVITKRSLYRLVKKFKEKRVYNDLPRRAQDKNSKLTPEMLSMINNELEENDEATARYLRAMLIEKYLELEVTISTVHVKRQRQALGWVYQATLLSAN